MACPFFYPTERMEWPSAPRTPLGAPYTGLCRAVGEFRPDEQTLRELCNFGYARTRCPHHDAAPFPDADAVRFHGGRYVLEKEYGPLHAGPVEELDQDCLRRQAAVFQQSRNPRTP